MTLKDAKIGRKYTITGVETNDEELNNFLFTLGCYSGEEIILVSKISESYVVSIKDGRYNMDCELANAIVVS